MFWSLSFHLLPDEEIVDDSTRKKSSGIKPAYSVFLTNKRAIFRFDSLGSSLTQSFFYHEIVDIKPCRRFFLPYVGIKTKKQDFLLNIADADYWSEKIVEMKGNAPQVTGGRTPSFSPQDKKRELFDMLVTLREKSLLTDEEFNEKVRRLDSLKF